MWQRLHVPRALPRRQPHVQPAGYIHRRYPALCCPQVPDQHHDGTERNKRRQGSHQRHFSDQRPRPYQQRTHRRDQVHGLAAGRQVGGVSSSSSCCVGPSVDRLSVCGLIWCCGCVQSVCAAAVAVWVATRQPTCWCRKPQANMPLRVCCSCDISAAHHQRHELDHR